MQTDFTKIRGHILGRQVKQTNKQKHANLHYKLNAFVNLNSNLKCFHNYKISGWMPIFVQYRHYI